MIANNSDTISIFSLILNAFILFKKRFMLEQCIYKWGYSRIRE